MELVQYKTQNRLREGCISFEIKKLLMIYIMAAAVIDGVTSALG